MREYYQARPTWWPQRRSLRDRVIEGVQALAIALVLLGLFAVVYYGVPIVAILLGVPLPGETR